MNEFTHQLSTLKMNRLLCLALGLTLAFVCQQARGQSAVTPPKISPKVAKYQAKLLELKSEKELLVTQLKAETTKLRTHEKELEQLKEREATLSVSADSYPEILKTIQSQRVQISIDLAGLDARYDAIAIAITEAIKKQNEEVLKPYKQLVEVREAKFQHLKKKGSTVKGLQDAEVALLEARMRLAEASRPSGSLSRLNSQLLDTSLERAEKTARLEKANSLSKNVEEYRTFQMALTSAEQKRQSSATSQGMILSRQKVIDKSIIQFEEKIATLLHE